ncbi:ATP-binding protein [Aquimarina rhabdastrellae]
MIKNLKRSVTLKVISGFVLACGIALGTFWIIHTQLTNYSKIAKIKSSNNDKLILVSQALTHLYDAESLSRSLARNSDSLKIERYHQKVDTIRDLIHDLAQQSQDSSLIIKTEEIQDLIDDKNKNFEELLIIYSDRQGNNFYRNAINELRKINESFGDQSYNRRFKHLKPHQRRVLIKFLKYSKKDNAQQLSYQTVDSIATKVKKVLKNLEAEEKRFLSQVQTKEESLTHNDEVITKRLRELLNTIEEDEIKRYEARIDASQKVLDSTSNIIIIVTSLIIFLVIIFLYLIIRDISNNQRYRTDLEAANAYTESLLESRESLINTVTHDLRSPLNTVIGYSALMEKTDLSHKQKHYLNHLKKSSDYILHLVNDLLDLSKLDAGKMTIESLPFSPKKLIENTVASVIPIEDPKNLSIIIDIDVDDSVQFISDPFRIKQILTNLIHNAYKFTENGSISITCDINSISETSSALTINVIDTGIGIDENQQELIFREFEQGKEEIEKQYGGFGLGLAITKRIVSLLQGTISLSSAINKGSIFSITIPVTQQSNEVSGNQNNTVDAKQFANKRVLIVDDDPSQLALSSELIASISLSYQTCSNVKDALVVLEKNKFDLILTDIQMPGYDGFYLLNKVKNDIRYKEIPIIALSGRTDISNQEYLSTGFTASLTKPYMPNDLISLISKIFDSSITWINTTPSEELTTTEYSLQDLMVFAHGDIESLHSILNTFYDSTSQNLTQLENAIMSKNIGQIKILAHKILPFLKQIKATKTVALLKQIETPEYYKLNEGQIIELAKNAVKEIHALIKKLKNDTITDTITSTS